MLLLTSNASHDRETSDSQMRLPLSREDSNVADRSLKLRVSPWPNLLPAAVPAAHVGEHRLARCSAIVRVYLRWVLGHGSLLTPCAETASAGAGKTKGAVWVFRHAEAFGPRVNNAGLQLFAQIGSFVCDEVCRYPGSRLFQEPVGHLH